MMQKLALWNMARALLFLQCNLSIDPVPNSAGNKMTAFHLIAEGSHLTKFG